MGSLGGTMEMCKDQQILPEVRFGRVRVFSVEPGGTTSGLALQHLGALALQQSMVWQIQ